MLRKNVGAADQPWQWLRVSRPTFCRHDHISQNVVAPMSTMKPQSRRMVSSKCLHLAFQLVGLQQEELEERAARAHKALRRVVHDLAAALGALALATPDA